MQSERWPLPASWRWKSLDEIGHVVGGGTPSTRDPANFSDQGMPWITPADLSGYNQTYIKRGRRSLSKNGLLASGVVTLPKGAVLFSSRAPIGYCVIAGNEMATSQGFKSLVLNPAMSPEYVHRYLISSANYAEERASGTTFKELSGAKFAALRIPVAPPEEQLRIATRLGVLVHPSIDAATGIAAALRVSRSLKSTILSSAFSGNLTAIWRRDNSLATSEMLATSSPHVEQATGGRKATDRVVEGGVGLRINSRQRELPAGWSWQLLTRLARQESGHTPSRAVPDYWDGDIPWVGVKDAAAHHGKVITTTVQTISAEGLRNSSARILPVGTVLLCRTAGSIGHVCRLGKPMATSQDFAAWLCGPALDPAYLMYLLMGERELLRRLGQGTAHPTIYLPEIRAFSIALAPLAEQVEIVRQLDSLFTALAIGDAEIEAARELTANYSARLYERAFRGQLEPVSKDPNLVDAALERHKAEFNMNKPQRRTAPKSNTSQISMSAATFLANKYDVWPSSGYSFEELRDEIKGSYEEVRAAIYEALRSKELTQKFDDRRRMMTFVRPSS